MTAGGSTHAHGPNAQERIRNLAASALLLACAQLAACSFDSTEMEPHTPNVCTVDTECTTGLSCQAGICVTSSDAALSYVLDITPKRMPDGSQPFPLQVGPFLLQDGRSDIELPVPVTLTGTVTDGALPIPAQLTFVPTKLPPAVARAITARATQPDGAYSVQLLSDVEYRVVVQPTDSSWPPHATTLVATDGRLDINYAETTRIKRKFLIENAPFDPSLQALQVRARAKQGGQVISSTAPLVGGRVELEFAQDVPFRLEISPEQSFARVRFSFDVCDEPASTLPTFKIDDDAFTWEDSDRTTQVFTLPDVPAVVKYQGEIELCTGRSGTDPLPVTLTANAVAFARLPAGLSASYSTLTTALPSDDKLGFCTYALPGDYVVVIPPPSGVNCEIFSEKRRIEPLAADAEEPEASENVLSLRKPAKLSGVIQDDKMMPIANATIEAVALGLSTDVMLAEDDPTVPVNNRSRQTSSDEAGNFALSVDVGSYDLVIKPPSQTGFAWKIQSRLNVAARVGFFTTTVELGAPALIEGRLRYRDGRNTSSLSGAEVHVYTVLDPNTPEARGIEIGRSTADDGGGVMLLVSPESELERPW